MDEITETLIFHGGAVKALGDGRIGGYLVRFTGPDDPDLEGDYFDAQTDFGGATRSTVYYQHGLDRTLKTRKLGLADLRTDEFGVWAETQLELRDEYEKFIYGLAEAGKMGWSSGTASHLVEREPIGKAWHIKHWPLGLDASLTPTPAEPRNAALPLKSFVPAELIGDRSGEDETESADADKIPHTIPADPRQGTEVNMEDNLTPGRDEEIKALETKLETVSDRLNAILAAIQDSPKVERAGYFTNVGGTNDAGHKSLGDFLLAVKRHDTERLAKVYKAQKDLGKDSGQAGGYLVPEEFANELLQITQATSPVAARVRRIPVNVDSGTFPALDYSVSPSAGSGQTPYAAGLSASTKEENSALDEDEPLFRQIEWRLHKVGGYTQASNELISDSPMAIEALLNMLFGVTVGNKNERNILRGSGAGEPLGILNAACTIAITTASNAVFGETDALNMLSRFKRVSQQVPVWIMHPGVLPDLNGFAASNVDMVDWTSGISGTLLGYPIIYSEHMPQDDNDDVILADLGAYLWFQKGGLEVAFSEHVGFTSDQGTWRFTQRNDGKPWLSAAITLPDPQGGYTVSPFLFHDD